jgi:hypothetical protein
MGEIEILDLSVLLIDQIIFFTLFKSHTGPARFSLFMSKLDEITGAE